MKNVLLSLLVCGLPIAARAQAPPGQAPADTARFYKHELGLTASPQLQYLFSANRVLPVGLLYKYHLNERNALRLRVVGRMTNTHSDVGVASPGGYLVQNRAWNVTIYGGWEATRRIGKRWDAGYGVEAGGSIGRSYYYSLLRTDGRIDSAIVRLRLVTNTITVSAGVQARGFASVGLRVGRYVRVFTETAIVASYDWSNFRGTPQPATDNTPLSGHNNFRRVSMNLLPVQFIGASVIF